MYLLLMFYQCAFRLIAVSNMIRLQKLKCNIKYGWKNFKSIEHLGPKPKRLAVGQLPAGLDYLQCLSFTLLQYIYFFNYVYHFCASWHNNKRMLLSSESSRSGFGPWWRENSNGKIICEGKIFRERRVPCAVESVEGVKSSDLCLQKHFLKYYFFFIFALIIEKCNMKKSIRINYNVIDNL